MGKYRKIDVRMWNDEKFRTLSDRGKLAFIFGLTHPHLTNIGAMRASLSGLAAEIGWPAEAFKEAFGEAIGKAMVRVDEEACFVWYPRFLEYNRPESPNVIKSWGASLDLLPECSLKLIVVHEVGLFVQSLTEAFKEALPKAFLKGMLNQEQEQDLYKSLNGKEDEPEIKIEL